MTATLRRSGCAALAVCGMWLAASPAATAQDPRLVDRLPPDALPEVSAIVDSAQALGLPSEPLVDRALEATVMRAPAERIVAAVRRLANELRMARDAFGPSASPAELTAGASALRAGATREDLARLRALRAGQSLTIAAGVLADLVAAGVPADNATAAVLALARDARDADYVAFRRNVQRDIALGASPTAALGVRLRAATAAADGLTLQGGANRSTETRKPKP